MAKKNEDTATLTEGAAIERNPAEPIGNPPGGGRWTWSIDKQEWVELSIGGDETN